MWIGESPPPLAAAWGFPRKDNEEITERHRLWHCPSRFLLEGAELSFLTVSAASHCFREPTRPSLWPTRWSSFLTLHFLAIRGLPHPWNFPSLCFVHMYSRGSLSCCSLHILPLEEIREYLKLLIKVLTSNLGKHNFLLVLTLTQECPHFCVKTSAFTENFHLFRDEIRKI